MKAIVIRGPGQLAIIDKEIPRPGPEEALVRIKYCGICGSDRHAFECGFLPPALTIGHEFSGEIAALGEACPGFQVGDYVTGNNIIACGQCHCCLAGRENLCLEMQRLGITAEGTMAEYALIPLKTLVKLADSAKLEHAALTEPLSVALHAANKVNTKAGQQVLILGGGAIGLLVLTLIKNRGAQKVYLVEPDPVKRQVAEKLGAAKTFNPHADKLEKDLMEQTGNLGADLIFECAGLPSTLADACSLAAPGSTIVICGIPFQPVELNFLSLVTREINLITAFGKRDTEFKDAAEMIAGGLLDQLPLISSRVSYREAEKAFREPPAGDIKTLLLF